MVAIEYQSLGNGTARHCALLILVPSIAIYTRIACVSQVSRLRRVGKSGKSGKSGNESDGSPRGKSGPNRDERIDNMLKTTSCKMSVFNAAFGIVVPE